jgi:predicted Rossmann fold nucleotide-binding protein DprA/Smf involved in DNA uptake
LGKSVKLGSSERFSEIQSVLRLGSVPGVGTRALWRILNRFGSDRRALAARSVELDAVAGMRCGEALASSGLERRVRDALDRCRTPAIAILLWSDNEYPQRLGHLVDPPPILFARDLGLVCGSSSEFRACVVSQGARQPVPAGLDDEACLVWVALSERSLGIDDVASGADLQSVHVLLALMILQVSGLVVQESGIRFRRVS